MSNYLILALVAVSGFVVFTFTPAGDQVAMAIVSQTDDYTQCLKQLEQRYPNHEFSDIGYEVTRAKIETSNRTPDLIFKLNGSDTCGTNGCIYEICLRDGATSELMTFGTAGQTLTVLGSSNSGMHDVALTTTDTFRLTWDGERYTINN